MDITNIKEMLEADPHIIAVVILSFVIPLITFICFGWKNRRSKLSHPLPPGPPGNHRLTAAGISFTEVHKQIAEWSETYGPVFRLQHPGDAPTIVITRYDAAVEIMERQGVSVADRPHWIAANEILSGGMRTLLSNYGPQFRERRKALHTHLHVNAVSRYEALQLQHAQKLVVEILRDPKNHPEHARRYAASIIMSMTYGKTTPTSYSDPEVIQINAYQVRLKDALTPGNYFVNSFPFLRHVPFYGMQLKRWRRDEEILFHRQIDDTKLRMAHGNGRPSFSQYLIENQPSLGFSDNEVAYLAGSMFGAGATTTASAITTMIMAAAKYPEAQAKVQDEVDRVVGRSRAPDCNDLGHLHQTKAFALETLRWRPLSSLGFPHRANKDIIWRGYLIPAGSTVMGIPWEIGRDSSVFEDGDAFNPQRWLDTDGCLREDVKNSFEFGFGRRVCPGQHVAKRSVIINTALLLWAFKIEEEPETPIDLMAFYLGAQGAYPMPFSVNFRPRTDAKVIKDLLTASEAP